jgi:uncharacterized membrane protein YdjX (TVP38/TMEM64 family)
LRLVLLVLALAVVFALPFLLFGEGFAAALSGEAAMRWLSGFGTFTGLAAVLLLACDLLLPVPASGVLATLGMLYGPLAGGAIGTLGLVVSGMVGWLFGRWIGRPLAARLCTPEEWAQAVALFARFGGPAVAVCRALPLLPEVMSLAAGIFGMRLLPFLIALLCGAVPVAFGFAAFGAAFADRPLLGVLLSLLVPALLWLAVQRLIGRIAVAVSGAAHKALQCQGQHKAGRAEKRWPAGSGEQTAIEKADASNQHDHCLRHIAGVAAREQAQTVAACSHKPGKGEQAKGMGEGEPEPEQR